MEQMIENMNLKMVRGRGCIRVNLRFSIAFAWHMREEWFLVYISFLQIHFSYHGGCNWPTIIAFSWTPSISFVCVEVDLKFREVFWSSKFNIFWLGYMYVNMYLYSIFCRTSITMKLNSSLVQTTSWQPKSWKLLRSKWTRGKGWDTNKCNKCERSRRGRGQKAKGRGSQLRNVNKKKKAQEVKWMF